MAKFVIAGVADCPRLAEAELLADDLSANLPHFEVHKIVKLPDEWREWLKKECKERNWQHSESPLIWRELVDRGGKGLYLGGCKDFSEFARHNYGFVAKLHTGEEYVEIGKETLCALMKEREMKAVAKESGGGRKTPPLVISMNAGTSNVAYHLVGRIGRGHVLGEETEVEIRLLDEEDLAGVEGIAMELEDCAFPLVQKVVATCDAIEAFHGADVILLHSPRDDTNLTDTTLESYAKIIDGLSKSPKVVFSGENCFEIAHEFVAKIATIPHENVTVLSRDIEMQAKGFIAQMLKVNSSDVRDVIVWGTSKAPFVDYSHARIHNHVGSMCGPPSFHRSLSELLTEKERLANEMTALKGRGAAALTTASALVNHLRDLVLGGPNNDIVSMGMISKGWYGIPEGTVFSFPVRLSVPGVGVDDTLELEENVQETVMAIAVGEKETD